MIKSAAKRDPEATRAEILRAACREIHEKGFRGASLDKILAETGVTKGALYHHFPDKDALGYAVVEEVIRAEVLETWVRPLIGAEDPIRAIQGILRGLAEKKSEAACRCGCPLNNLAQEMSPLDEGFRMRIEAVFKLWRGAVAEALERGRIAGSVRKEVNARTAAAFIVASFEGITGLAKNAQDPSVLHTAGAGLVFYLESLRAR